jgi:phosphohistidine swiveling domain-containing protein
MISNPSERVQSLLVAPLAAFGRADLLVAGGKGANLGELSRAGFNVPPGFVITTAAYDLLLQENNLKAPLIDLLVALDPDNPDSVNKTSQQIQDLFKRASIPGQLVNEIIQAYQKLKHDAVAVRSSATAEDLPEAAFAGQQETFLNILGEKQLLEAVHSCWTSLWSERAILYRAQQHVDQQTVKLAVVVQAMVPADAAGVMFTANPVSGARDELIIDASLGLGEAVVSGFVTPDHVIIHKRSLHIKDQQRGSKEILIRSKPGGGTEQVTSAQEIRDTAALSPHVIRKLSRLGIQIERHYGMPQDIEWAWVQNGTSTGTLFILQARPMTALPEPLKINGPMRLVVPLLAEMWPTRPYPLDMTTFTGTIDRAIGALLVAMIGRSAPRPDEAFLEEDGVVVQFKPPQVHPSLSMLFTPWITLWHTRHYDVSRWEADPLLAEYKEAVHTLEQRDLGALTWKQLIDTLNETLALLPRIMELRVRYVPQAILSLAGLWLLLALTRQSHQFGVLVSGVRTKTTETNLALEDLAEQIRANATLKELFEGTNVQDLQARLKTSQAGQAFWKRFEEFINQYGHRETSLTISQPAWKDAPENVLAILKVLAQTEALQPESYQSWQRERDELLSHSVLGRGYLRKLFCKLLTKTRCLFQIREDTHFYATMVQPVIRHLALELGERLVKVGALDSPQDIFHLRRNELEVLGEPWPPSTPTVAQLRSLVARRKAKRERLADKPMIDPRLLSVTSQTQRSEDVLLQGTSGSPGVASGPVRIVHDVSEFGLLRRGDVLVAPVTNPAWTPLFQRAVAVVVDTGGAASHAAIVAREYGIPAVMGTMNGTKALKDGQRVKVDGSRGLVYKMEEQK